MNRAQAPLPGTLDLPWESDVIRITYNGGMPRYATQWSFKRVNSKISAGVELGRGSGNSVAF